MGEIIQLHVGQAGVQIANACWELYCLEHGIQADGTLCECPCDNSYKNFFILKDSNKVVPRAVLVDAEPTVIDQVRTGPFRQLYSPNSLITGMEDSGSNFARGYYTTAPELLEITMEAIRNVAESSSNLQGFMTFRSIGGGTGSGVGNAIAERIHDDYDKVSSLEFVVFPSPSISPLIVEPYNALIATHYCMDTIQCSFVLENEALYDICECKLNVNAPRYTNLNRIIGQTASTFTTSQRFGGTSNMSFLEIETNLVPYPRIHFPLVSFAPFIAENESAHTDLTTEQITNACFDSSYQLVRCNPKEGKYMACVLLYRGNVFTADVNNCLSQLRASETVQFVDWSPTGFKVGMNKQIPFSIPGGDVGHSSRSLVTLSNNTIIHEAWCRLIKKYERLYSRRAFIHHFIEEGMEEDSLKEASDDIYALISDYKEVNQPGPPSHVAQKTNKPSLKLAESKLPPSSGRMPKKLESEERMPRNRNSLGSPRMKEKLRNKQLSAPIESTEEMSLPQLPGLRLGKNPQDSSSRSPLKNQRGTRRPSLPYEASDENSLRQLPGIQSLNYFFCESSPMEFDGRERTFSLECEGGRDPSLSTMSKRKDPSRQTFTVIAGKNELNKAGPSTDMSQKTKKSRDNSEETKLRTTSGPGRFAKTSENDREPTKVRDTLAKNKQSTNSYKPVKKISTPQLSVVQPRDKSFKSPSRKVTKVQQPTVSQTPTDENSLPQLPGIQSLNYFFCESSPIVTSEEGRKFSLECDSTKNQSIQNESSDQKCAKAGPSTEISQMTKKSSYNSEETITSGRSPKTSWSNKLESYESRTEISTPQLAGVQPRDYSSKSGKQSKVQESAESVGPTDERMPFALTKSGEQSKVKKSCRECAGLEPSSSEDEITLPRLPGFQPKDQPLEQHQEQQLAESQASIGGNSPSQSPGIQSINHFICVSDPIETDDQSKEVRFSLECEAATVPSSLMNKFDSRSESWKDVVSNESASPRTSGRFPKSMGNDVWTVDRHQTRDDSYLPTLRKKLQNEQSYKSRKPSDKAWLLQSTRMMSPRPTETAKQTTCNFSANEKEEMCNLPSLCQRQSKRLNFEQGYVTEACRAKETFCRIARSRSASRERSSICNTCQPCCCDDQQPIRYYQIATTDPCDFPRPTRKSQILIVEDSCCKEGKKQSRNLQKEDACCSNLCSICKASPGSCFWCRANKNDVSKKDD